MHRAGVRALCLLSAYVYKSDARVFDMEYARHINRAHKPELQKHFRRACSVSAAVHQHYATGTRRYDRCERRPFYTFYMPYYMQRADNYSTGIAGRNKCVCRRRF